jgi:triosephosphate isomerase (TIM)
MRQLIAGNWKMHLTRAEAIALAHDLRSGGPRLAAELAVFPPFTTLSAVAEALAGSGIGIGGQDCHQEPKGAHTGDISAPMLRDAGASWVILGHSERRESHGETDEVIREKTVAAVAAGLTPIVCVGETEAQRQTGQETEVVGWQLAGSLPKGFQGVVAYEPVWAIGSGRTPSQQEVAALHAFIREELVRQFGHDGRAIRVLYGGSVKPANAAGLLAIPEVNGALVGGASLVAGDFLAIARAARQG